MNQTLGKYITITLSGDLRADVEAVFNHAQDPDTLDHVMKVAEHAVRISERFGVDRWKAERAALLHDISNIIPVREMLEAAEASGIQVTEEEYRYPRIVHQKLSMAMAEQLFGISDPEILNAIECHTTLKKNPTQLDKVLFIADKISWELPGDHPYLDQIRDQVKGGWLDEAVLTYLDHVWEQRDQLRLVHSWLIAAREELKLQVEYHSNKL
ncbi:bis(5'-nucleosyl)-tetraphosphatase (symmetrical) YqeK [Paenibacillus lemnae]|uniref:bis(5'-nucleosyl)-tetraphosphatase (symmetrical) n=1 Tax=Paenibacillus lemnae TaxID=1330551 RepID=A0A848M8V7_PAELE|nr:bis(5'-nucleosyl)-tetraphosphatase (symmetrical) YqeK [Paenibacillus lemnae]NMO97036.1 HD domain-containing protein [Paenibacillus lemnae]